MQVSSINRVLRNIAATGKQSELFTDSNSDLRRGPQCNESGTFTEVMSLTRSPMVVGRCERQRRVSPSVDGRGMLMRV